VDKFAIGVKKVLKVPLEQYQFDAVISFAYNVGLGSLKSSTLLKKINNSEFKEASEEFGKWNKASGKVLTGLTKRREAERQMFIGL
jgi:lysozyme